MTYQSPLIKAPFTNQQLKDLKLRQNGKLAHKKTQELNRYLCPEMHEGNAQHVLEAFRSGLKCQSCGYVQSWALPEIESKTKASA